MDLLIDIGNTRIKWAILDAGSLHGADAIEHRADAVITDLLDRVAMRPIRVIAANVAGEPFATLLGAAVHDRWGVSVQFATTQSQAGRVRNGYEDFHQLGIDRWLAIIAAADRFSGAVCVVDAGTAITIDALTADGAHLGGYIMPGFDLMQQSLDDQTGTLRRLAGDGSRRLPDGPPVPGCNTAQAIGGGTLAAVCGAVGRCVAALSAPQAHPTLVVTGGDAVRLTRHLDITAHLRPHLVLEGLARYEFDLQAGS